MAIRHDEGKLARKLGPGPGLYFNTTFPEGAPRAVVALLHGYADYGARYAHVTDAWAARGIATVSIDLRGHGHAEGVRVFCEHFEEFLDDAKELTRLVGERAPDVPRILFGHSFGGLVATSYVLADPAGWRGLVLSSPFFGLGLPVPAVKLFAGKIASRIAPKLGQPSGLHGRDMTHDPEHVRKYDSDPLIFKNVTPRWFTESASAQTRALARAGALTLPLYVVAGLADKVASPAEARRFFDAAGSTDKTWSGREGLFHETLNELEWRTVADPIADWILAHV